MPLLLEYNRKFTKNELQKCNFKIEFHEDYFDLIDIYIEKSVINIQNR